MAYFGPYWGEGSASFCDGWWGLIEVEVLPSSHRKLRATLSGATYRATLTRVTYKATLS